MIKALPGFKQKTLAKKNTDIYLFLPEIKESPARPPNTEFTGHRQKSRSKSNQSSLRNHHLYSVHESPPPADRPCPESTTTDRVQGDFNCKGDLSALINK